LFIKIFEGKDILLIICSIDSGAEWTKGRSNVYVVKTEDLLFPWIVAFNFQLMLVLFTKRKFEKSS
jgi:hypothetical protein